jgi:hypothetical protein
VVRAQRAKAVSTAPVKGRETLDESASGTFLPIHAHSQDCRAMENGFPIRWLPC